LSDQHTFFTDRDLGRRFPEVLRQAGLSVETHDGHFQPTTPDEDWLSVVGSSGWIALTRDTRIRYRPNERDAVMRHRVALIVLIGSAPLTDLARNLIATRKTLYRFLAAHPRPFIAKIYRPGNASVSLGTRPGRIEMSLVYSGWSSGR